MGTRTSGVKAAVHCDVPETIVPPRALVPQEIDGRALRVSTDPKHCTVVFVLRREDWNQKKFRAVIELFLFAAIKRNGTFPQPTEMITLGFIFGKSTFHLVKL